MTTPQEVRELVEALRCDESVNFTDRKDAADMLEELARLKEVRDEDVDLACAAYVTAIVNIGHVEVPSESCMRAAIVAYLGGEG